MLVDQRIQFTTMKTFDASWLKNSEVLWLLHEVIVFGPKHLRNGLTGFTLASSTAVKNLGVIFDQDMSFKQHINQVCKTAFFHLRICKGDHVSLVLAFLHWLPVKFRIEFKIQLLTYNALNCLAPRYLQDLIARYAPNRALRSQSAGLLVVPRISKSRFGGRAFCYQAPLLWNQLPVWVQEADTTSIFKTKLKTFVFSKAYS